MIVNYVDKNGIMDKKLLNEYPFSKNGLVYSLFEGKIDKAHEIIKTIDMINQRIYI